MAPRGTPQAIIEKLNASITKALTSDEVSKRLVRVGATPPPPLSSTETLAMISAESRRLGAVIQAVRGRQK